MGTKEILEKNNNNKQINKDIIINISILLLFGCITFLFLLKSPLHIWTGGEASTDSSVLKTVALMISNGKVPYLDTFDHKGPYIYIINWLWQLISYYKGVWLFEFINLFVTLSGLYKIARLKCNKPCSIIVTLISVSLLFNYFESGNLTEEYALPLIAWSLYIFLDYLINEKVNNLRLIICGFCFGGILLLRVNMGAAWVVFCLAILIKCLKEKKFSDLTKFIVFFIIGIAIILIPVMVWLGFNGALSAFWEEYIEFNQMYISSAGNRATIRNKIEAFGYFFINPLTIISFIIVTFAGNKKKEPIYIIYILYMILTIYFICISGMKYNHYGMTIIPMLAFPFSLLYEFVNEKVSVKYIAKEKKQKYQITLKQFAMLLQQIQTKMMKFQYMEVGI